MRRINCVGGFSLCGACTPAGYGIANLMFSGLRADSSGPLRRVVLTGDVLSDRASLPVLTPETPGR